MSGRYYAIIVVICLGLTGCNHYGAIPKDFGNSYNRSKSDQILNPEAGGQKQPVTGLAGKAADTTMKKYMDSFAPSGQAAQSQNFAIVPVTPPGASGTVQDVYGK